MNYHLRKITKRIELGMAAAILLLAFGVPAVPAGLDLLQTHPAEMGFFGIACVIAFGVAGISWTIFLERKYAASPLT